MKKKIKDILVVDDDPSILELIRIILSRRGYTVHQAIDGGDGIQKYLDLEPDLVICDIAMPAGDGFNVAIYISNRERDQRRTPVLLISAFYDEYSNRENAARCGADGFLAKPFTQQQLLEAIEEVVMQAV